MKKAIAAALAAITMLAVSACAIVGNVIADKSNPPAKTSEARNEVTDRTQNIVDAENSNQTENREEPSRETPASEMTVKRSDSYISNREAGLILEYEFTNDDLFDGLYEELPHYIFEKDRQGKNEFTGNYYCTPGVVLGASGPNDAEEFIIISVIYYGFDGENEIWENNKYESFLITKGAEAEDWMEIELGDLVLVYFEYMGYSEHFAMQCGRYERSVII